VFAARYELPFWQEECNLDMVGCVMFSLRFNAAVSITFFIWWLLWGIVSKTYGLGVCSILTWCSIPNRHPQLIMLPHLSVMWITSNMFYFWAEQTMSHWQVHPVFYMAAGFTALQTLSHLAEGNIPPRANGTDRWMTLREFASRHNKLYVFFCCYFQSLRCLTFINFLCSHVAVVVLRSGLFGFVNEVSWCPFIVKDVPLTTFPSSSLRRLVSFRCRCWTASTRWATSPSKSPSSTSWSRKPW
jgi:hypothetical protein